MSEVTLQLATETEIQDINDLLTDADGLKFNFSKNESGQHGYLDENGEFKPFGEGGSGVSINDNVIATDSTWSSDKISKNLSNPNLLDNPWFTVNQRGLTTYENYGYTVDRWILQDETGEARLTVNSDKSITLRTKNNDGVRQVIPYNLDANKPYTMSCLTNNGILSGTFMPKDGPIIDYPNSNIKFGCIYDSNIGLYIIYPYIQYTSTVIEDVIYSVKLEVGTVSTLANDVAPNYAEEIIKCSCSNLDSSDTYANKSYYSVIANDVEQLNKNVAQFGNQYAALRIPANLSSSGKLTQLVIKDGLTYPFIQIANANGEVEKTVNLKTDYISAASNYVGLDLLPNESVSKKRTRFAVLDNNHRPLTQIFNADGALASSEFLMLQNDIKFEVVGTTLKITTR